MQYTPLGNTGYRVSRLGFGSMRLPMVQIGDKEYVDIEQAIAVLHRAFELGVNYVDCGLMYCSEESEYVVGLALEQWPRRDEIIVTTKATKFRMQKPGDLRRMLDHQLWKLRRSKVHFYMFHGIGWDNWHEIDKSTSWIEDMARAKEEGLFEHCGFSFHDKPEAMLRLVDEGLFGLVTCQYNYLDRANEEAIQYASDKGLGVVVMGPVGGGRLAMMPSGVREQEASSDRTAAELALRFVLSHPGVDVALSGMGSIEMVEQNWAAAEKGPLNADETSSIKALMDRNKELARLYCTGCQYCMPCPNGVNIPRCFEIYNYDRVYGMTDYSRQQYVQLVSSKNDASLCIECGVCLDRCPQHIEIPKQLQQVRERLGGQP
jgi:predicted aldo/keto reductase-like oxidoreductase